MRATRRIRAFPSFGGVDNRVCYLCAVDWDGVHRLELDDDWWRPLCVDCVVAHAGAHEQLARAACVDDLVDLLNSTA